MGESDRTKCAITLLLVSFSGLGLGAIPAHAQADAAQPASRMSEENLLLLEVHVERFAVGEGMGAYQLGKTLLLPLGELARMLSLAITVDGPRGKADGWFIRQERKFALDLAAGTVESDGKKETLDPAAVIAQGEEIYVASHVLSRWLPIELDVDTAGLILHVHPRELLPLQEQLERMKRAGEIKEGSVKDVGYVRRQLPYRWLSLPFVDLKLGTGLSSPSRGAPWARQSASYSAYAAGDLAAMEGTLFMTGTESSPGAVSRLVLGRTDPDGELLGPLHARTYSLGAISLAPFEHVSQGSDSGRGFSISNRPLARLSRFDTYSVTGDLLPEWDVEIFHNGVPVGFQRSREDGKYEFRELPLLYGTNEYQLVFHGPLGERREEIRRFFLNDSMIQPGEFYYDFGLASGGNGELRTRAQFDKSLLSNLSLTTAFVTQPKGPLSEAPNEARHDQALFANVGVRTFWRSVFLSGDVLRSNQGGTLGQLGLKTYVAGITLGGSHAVMNHFISEALPVTNSPLLSRSRLRADFRLPLIPWRMPVGLEVQRDHFQWGEDSYELNGKISTYLLSSNLSYQAHASIVGSTTLSDGTFILSRRIGGLSLRGELAVNTSPERYLSLGSLTADVGLGKGYLLSQNLTWNFRDPELRYVGTLSKTLGDFAFGTSLGRSTRGESMATAQLSIALGVDPRGNRLLTDAMPLTKTGAISARAFRDLNNNGVLDANEEILPGVGFIVDGSRPKTRTGVNGFAYLDYLPTRQLVNVGVDPGTVEDPQLLPIPQGIRVVPRPGTASQVDFALVPTVSVEGTFTLDEGGKRRPAGNVEIELVDPRQEDRVLARAKTSSDGYYILTGVPPGSYQLRVAPEQAKRVRLESGDLGMVAALPGTEVVAHVDRVLRRKPLAVPTALASLETPTPDPRRGLAAASDRAYFVDLQKLIDLSRANLLAEKVRERGFTCEVPVIPGSWWVTSVKAGQLQTRAEAEALAGMLKELGFLPSIQENKQGFAVYSGRYATTKSAFEGLDQLAKEGFNEAALESTEEETPFVVVRAGPFATVEEAKAALKQLSDLSSEATLFEKSR